MMNATRVARSRASLSRSIQAIEVCPGVGQIPAEFLADACAVIAIWTKSY
jgi:hypothetical protein